MNTNDSDQPSQETAQAAAPSLGPLSGDTPYLRISNDRYAKDSSFDDRLSADDERMLQDMGILL